jgi:hypothetical protein
LTLSWPAYFGAVPCVASNRATVSDRLAPGRDTDAADLRGQRVGDVVAVQVQRGDDRVLARTRQDLLQHGVGDHVLDDDFLAGVRVLEDTQGPPSSISPPNSSCASS